jgi:hypothetical protein
MHNLMLVGAVAACRGRAAGLGRNTGRADEHDSNFENVEINIESKAGLDLHLQR